jgi:4-hydroxy-tetrahydrodipicolinate synthase
MMGQCRTRAQEVSVISGVFVPMLTAFAADGSVEYGASAEHARWLASVGADGLVPFGTSGEGPSLSVREKRALLDSLCAAVPGVPIVPAITEASLDAALELVRAANDAPVAAIMVLPPYYFRPLGEEGLRRFFAEILAASTRPVVLYHIPEFAPPVPLSLVAELPIWGVKDSGGDINYTRGVLDAGKRVVVGAENTIIDAVKAGGDGTIAGLANVMPEHLLAVVAATRDGDIARAGEILAQALQFRSEMLAIAGPQEWVAIMKLLAQSRHGVKLGGARLPLPAAPAAADGLGARLSEVLAAANDSGLLP